MRQGNFGIKLGGVIAVVLLVAACQTAPEESAEAASQGGQTASAPVTTAPATTTTAEAEPAQVQEEEVVSVVPGSQEDLVLNVGDRVFFGFDRFDLDLESQGVLERQAAWLQANPLTRVIIEGHTDERGTREYNLGLGERRANAINEFLVSLGVDPSRIEAISYGKERPIALGSNDSAWAQNRRGVTTVVN